MFVTLLLSFALISPFALSYNIDTVHPVVFKDPEPGGNNYFGYSVALRSMNNSGTLYSLFVGAPRSQNQEGSVYRCTFSPYNKTSNYSPCQRLIVDKKSIANVLIMNNTYWVKRGKESGWMGASMATGESSDFTVCAPNSLFNFEENSILQSNENQLKIYDACGVCYNVPNGNGNVLYRDNVILKSIDLYHFEINKLHGFSISYTTKKNMNARIIGEPNANKVEFTYQNKRETKNQDIRLLSNLGYAVSSGCFFKRDKLLFVAGAPSLKSRGAVVVYEPDSFKQSIIDGNIIGQYFGASLAVGDFDGDALDDIAVGAPHWGEVDYGRVYTYYGNNDGTFQEGVMMQGKIKNGLFGYALTAGDLDNDGKADLVASAPWEGNSGVVYVFYGHQNFRFKGQSIPIVQRIAPSEFAHPISLIKRFGFSLSPPVDVDKNGYPDLAIGAYKSGHAVLLGSKPTITTNVSLRSYPTVLQKTIGSFVIGVCIKYHGTRVPNMQKLKVQIAVDEDYKRIKSDSAKIFVAPFLRDSITCVNSTFELSNDIVNFVDPIVIRVRHEIDEMDNEDKSEDGFCWSCPILTRKKLSEITQLHLPFNTGCTDGTICNSRLSIKWIFTGVKNANEWAVGSGDVNLNLQVRNDGEPAYLSQLTISIPPGISLRNAIPSCIENQGENVTITLVCDVGNPLKNGEMKNLNVNLDMGIISKSSGGTILSFILTMNTRSVDHGKNNSTVIELKLKNEASISLTGVTNEKSHNYGKTKNTTKVPLRHAYQVRKIGPTPITQAYLAVDVPIGLIDRNISFTDIQLPKLESSGQFYECSVNDAKLSYKLLQRKRRQISSKELNIDKVMRTGTQITKLETDFKKKNETPDEKGIANFDRQITKELVYLNCSTDNVRCATILCHFSLLKTSEDIGNLILDVTFDSEIFYGSDEKTLPVKFSTNASVQVIHPIVLELVNDTRQDYASAEASTTLYNIPEPKELAKWILPSSIAFGLLLFCILTIILLKVGFFKRPKKEEKKVKEKIMELRCNNGDSDPYG